MEKQTFTRKELYDLVWSESLLSLSKKYNISDVGLRKICIRISIPLPQNGHWQKIQFGKKVGQTSLPANYTGDQEITLTFRGGGTDEVADGLSILKALQKEIETDLKSKLIVPEKLTNPDKLIVAAKNSLMNQKPDGYLYKGTVSCLRDQLDIRVARGNVGRTLRFMHTLIKALRARGHDVQIKIVTTYAIVEEHDFKILFREKMKKEVYKDGNWDRTVYHPSGILSFQLNDYPTKEWKDGKLPIEAQLSKIIAQLELTGKEWKERRIQWKKEEEERQEKERLQHEFEMRQEKDLTEFKETLQKASRWHKAVNLRNYIDAVEQKAIATNDISEELKNWLLWARKKADWYDPFMEMEDMLLKEVDKESLTIKLKTGYSSWESDS